MALTQPRTLFGIHQVTLYERATYVPYGTMRVLGGSTLSLEGEIISLTGGSNRCAWDAQDGLITPEMTLKPKEIPNFLFKVLLGKSPTSVLSDPGSVDALANVKGTSLQLATTGIASVGVTSGSENDLKFGTYVVVAASPTTVNVHGMGNVDFRRGTAASYIDDTLKVNAAALTITTGGVTTLPNFGVEFTGGSGVIAMATGDTAIFSIYPPSLEKMNVNIGSISDGIPEFGAIILAQKQGDGTMWEFDAYRVKALGFPFGMEQQAYNEPEITATLMYDSVKDAAFAAKYLKPSVAGS